jgi:hypothetical protein
VPKALLHQLEQANQQEGCLLCVLERQQIERYLEGVANDGVNNIPLRKKLLQRGGYCAAHSAVFAALASPLSAAILLESFVVQRLDNAAAGKRPLQVNCEACEVGQNARASFARSIQRHRKSSELQEQLLKSELCLSHLELVCQAMPEPLRTQLVARHATLRQNLQELIRKYDYRFSHEKISEEEIGSIKAVVRLLGQQSIGTAR